MRIAKVLSLGFLGLFTIGGGYSLAALSPVGTFSGPYTENWESFSIFQYGPIPSPTTIMGGAASISSPSGRMTIFTHGFFGLGSSGQAWPSDGAQAFDINDGSAFNDPYPTANIKWNTSITTFGAFFGAATPDSIPTTISVQFFDQANSLIGSDSFSYIRGGDGVLEWHGWNSSIPFASVAITGNFLALDGLQASVVPVPEPTILVFLVFLVFGLLGGRFSNPSPGVASAFKALERNPSPRAN